MDLPTLKVERLYRQISNLLINCIQNGQFLPGDMLPSERDLAKKLGVSRSSVREALIALEITGWVEIRTGNGVYVCDPLPLPAQSQPEEEFSLKSLILARQAFEGLLAEMAARNGSEDQRTELMDIMRDLTQLNTNDEKFLSEDKRFHLMIGEMSGNEVLRDMMDNLWNKRTSSRFVRLESHYAQVDFPVALQQDHYDIAIAIFERDPVRARECMVRHLQHVYDQLFSNS